MSIAKDLSGNTYGRLTVIKQAARVKPKKTYWECVCACGNLYVTRADALKSGQTQSCGCYQKEQSAKSGKKGKHYSCNTPEYKVWAGAVQRVTNSNYAHWDRYGGRGISMCKEWLHSPEQFIKDMGKRPSVNHSIDRINNDGNYEPSNCRWATKSEQMKNRHHRDISGMKNHNAKMSDIQVMMARVKYLFTGINQANLAIKYGISKASMNKILHGDTRQIVF